jgi:hypothetical protein
LSTAGRASKGSRIDKITRPALEGLLKQQITKTATVEETFASNMTDQRDIPSFRSRMVGRSKVAVFWPKSADDTPLFSRSGAAQGFSSDFP